MISLWNKELSLAEVTELISEYNPVNHSAYADSAVNVWPLGEDLITSNASGTEYEIKNNFYTALVTTNMTSDNFKLVDLTEYNSINIRESTFILTNVVLNATDATPLANASVKLISVSDTYTTTTDSNGSFTFSNTPIRSYTIEVSAEGFVTYSTSFDAESTSSISLSPETVGADLKRL